jgi:phosphoglycerol transferase MdoB-like AlkP superfamily enzyme
VLGFDEFIDIKSFTHTAQTTQQQDQGPYVSDQALTDKILDTLAQPHEQPLFIFAITMENHGPLHLEQITDSEQRQWVSEPLPQNCQELAIYLRHLANADQMILRLLRQLSASNATTDSPQQRPAQLLWYGDHVPVLTKVYEQFGYPDGHTDYFLWRSDETSTERASAFVDSAAQYPLSPQPLHVHQLAAELFK